MRRAILAIMLLVGGVTVSVEEPIPYLRAFTLADDSLTFITQWNAAELSRSTRPTGYEWELWFSENDSINKWGGLDSLLTGGVTDTIPPLSAQATVHFVCPEVMQFYAFYVRAQGSWADTASWGRSSPFGIDCANLPPAPPTVSIDTLAIDTIFDPLPDSIIHEAVFVSNSASFTPRSEGANSHLQFDAFDAFVTLCPFTWRDGEKALPGAGLLEPVAYGPNGVVEIAVSPTYPDPCYDIVARRNGADSVTAIPSDSARARVEGN